MAIIFVDFRSKKRIPPPTELPKDDLVFTAEQGMRAADAQRK